MKKQECKRKIIATRRYKAGYDVRIEEIPYASIGDEPLRILGAYTKYGDYIGDPKTAYRLCKKRGIQPELASLKDNVCSIGFCKREQKWYGWGPEALCGFGIGSKTVRGDYGYIPFDANDMQETRNTT